MHFENFFRSMKEAQIQTLTNLKKIKFFDLI